VKNIDPMIQSMTLSLSLKSCFSFSKAALVSLFPSHFFLSFFTFYVEEAASCRKDRLSKNISFKPKLDHPNLTKAARQ
jgi:hypothetical protein